MVIGMPQICHTLWFLILTTLPLPKDPAIALEIQVYRLHKHVNRHEESGQQRTASGQLESGNELLVMANRKHSQQKFLWHL